MRYSYTLLPLAAQAVNILLSNDDGWAEINIRTFYNALTSAGNNVVLSAPAQNESGTGSDNATPQKTTQACEFNSCPSGSPAYGSNATNPRFNYVNSYPVTSVEYGLQDIIAPYFSAPDIIVTGPNVGANLGTTVTVSGTVGAASYGATQGYPAIAFSGSSGSQTAWTVNPVPSYSTIYASLATTVTDAVIAGGAPYLPSGIFLNVNFPAVGTSTCNSASDFKYVLSRINTASSGTAADVNTCGSTRLPTETTVVGTSGCYVSISVGVASSKSDASATQQQTVLNKISSLLTCLP